jgi:predicted DNA-binding WGR domain protein
MARYELQEGTSAKFWEITLSGRSFTTHWGRIGGAPTNQTKSWPDEATARKEHDKLVHEKERKGYVLAGGKKGAERAKAGAPGKKKAPKGEAEWQVHADELQSKGDPRGEVIAIQEALKKKPNDPALREAERQALRPLLTGTLADYLDRFGKMAEGLKKESGKVFLGWFPLPPAPEREIAAVEEALGYPLHDSIKTFYRQTNGLQLFAIDRDAENFDAALHRPLKKPLPKAYDPLTESPGPTHSIHIKPIREAFLSDYENILYFDWMSDGDTEKVGGKNYPQLSLAKSLRPFDDMTNYYMVGFVLIEKTSNPPVAIGEDYGADWGSKRTTDLAGYLELLLETRGAIEPRIRYFRESR